MIMKSKFLLAITFGALLAIGHYACSPDKPKDTTPVCTVEDAPAQPTEAQPQVLLAQVADDPVPAQEEVPDTPQVDEGGGGFWAWVRSNWTGLVFALFTLAEAIVRLTPSEKDDSLVNLLKRWIDKLLPNRAVGGGAHT